MPSLLYNDIVEIISNFSQLKSIQSFYESGTYYGSTTLNMQPYFKQIITVEVSLNIYNRSHNYLNSHPNIKHFNQPSEDFLKEFLILNQDEFIFFLDGHYSSGDTSLSTIDVPLLEELNHINNLYKKNGLIIIDDFNLFETNSNEDWSNISVQNILNCFTNNQINTYYIHNERMIIIINTIL